MLTSNFQVSSLISCSYLMVLFFFIFFSDYRNRNIVVAVSDTIPPPMENEVLNTTGLNVCGQQNGVAPTKTVITCNQNGRYVYVYHKDPRTMMSLCEVEVYGS